MNKIPDRIMQQRSYADFKKLIDRWSVLSENIQKTPFKAPVMLPDIFLISGSGLGRTHLLEYLSDFLYENDNLMDFYGDVRYFEFRLNYCKPDKDFTEIKRLMSEIRMAAGFRNEYKGIVYVEVDDWVGHCQEKYFLDFLEYMSDNSDSWLVVVSVSSRDKAKVNELCGVVSAFLRIETVNIEAPTEQEFLQYLHELLFAYGLETTQAARDILLGAVRVLSETKYFDGYRTVKKLAQDIVYYVLSKEKGKVIIDAEDVTEFSESSEYISRTLKKIAKVKQIGF